MGHELVPAQCRVKGHSLHYVRGGDGPPLVFLHGVLGSHRTWDRLATEMARTHTVVAPDLFGCGASDRPDGGDYSLGSHAGAVRDLLDDLGLGPVTLVGHSLGGGIAMDFTYLFPKRVRGLVLVSSGGLGREVHGLLRAPTLPLAEYVLPLVASGPLRRNGAALGRMLRAVGVRGSTDVVEAWAGFEQLGDAASRKAFLATIRSVVGPEGQRVSARELLPRLDVPTLVVWGGADRLIPVAHGREAAGLIPGARLVEFERAGHFPHLDEPDRFAGLMHEFTAGLRGRRPGAGSKAG